MNRALLMLMFVSAVVTSERKASLRAPRQKSLIVHKGLMNLAELRHRVEAEIASYVYEVPQGAVGSPMSGEWVATQLAEFTSALVEPAWHEIKLADSVEQMLGKTDAEFRECVLLADDQEGYQLYYDPLQGDFVLAYSSTIPPTAFLRGDAVGCFMAR